MASYNAEKIKVLEGLDAVRMRPGMYIGSTGSRGLHHMLWEIVDNAVDEAMGGYADTIDVTLHEDGSASVWDNGRGVPVDEHPTLKVSGVEVIYTRLHAGGKFDNDNYSYSGGLHGVGGSVVNALSEWMTVNVYREFKHWQIRFESVFDTKQGKVVAGRVTEPLHAISNTRKRGTLVRFKPDARVFETTDFNGDLVLRRLKELAYLNKGVTITLEDERRTAPEPAADSEENGNDNGNGNGNESGGRTVFCYEGGIIDYVKYLNAEKSTLFSEPIYLEGNRDDILFRVAIQYTDSYTENIFSYVNNIPTSEGGTHETGFRAAYTKVLNDFAAVSVLSKTRTQIWAATITARG